MSYIPVWFKNKHRRRLTKHTRKYFVALIGFINKNYYRYKYLNLVCLYACMVQKNKHRRN